jgi:hypothetical protein
MLRQHQAPRRAAASFQARAVPIAAIKDVVVWRLQYQNNIP